MSSRSARLISRMASRMSRMSGTSPKSRMPGRITPPHTSQRGTPSQSATTSGGKRFPQPGQVLI